MRPKRLPEAGATVRQRIADALRGGPATAKDLSREAGVSEREGPATSSTSRARCARAARSSR
jgi:hypothetical protein